MRIDWHSFVEKRTREKGQQFPTGSRVYKGFQGSGKTLSMVKYAFDVKRTFPDCKIYSNIELFGIPYVFLEKNSKQADAVLAHALAERRGADGVLVLLDEAHLYFHKTKGIPLDVLTAISQQRKDRRKLVFSSQIWEELDISLRKQVKEVVDCKTVLGIEVNTIRDGETIEYDKLQGCWVAKKIETQLFKLNDLYFHRYDTYQKIITNAEYERPLGISEKTEPLIVAPEKHGLFGRKRP